MVDAESVDVTDPEQVKTRTLADVIAFNAATPEETVLFGQELFELAQTKGDLTTPDYVEARAQSFRLAGPEGIDRMMAENAVVALIAPTTSRAWTNDPEDDDEFDVLPSTGVGAVQLTRALAAQLQRGSDR